MTIPQSARCRMPLRAKPEILQAVVAAHGDAPIQRYELHGLWQVHLYRYSGSLKIAHPDLPGIEKVVFPITPGSASVLPPGTHSEYQLRGRSHYLYAHFALPAVAGDLVPVPIVQELGSDYLRMNADFEEVVAGAATRRWRAEVKLWDILCRLSEREPEGDGRHPAVCRVQEAIELRLAEPLAVSDLADAVGLSQSHLGRIFRADTGRSVKGYIMERRVQRARHLLVHSTRPIKSIAAETGMADLHLFNKTIRRYLGESPQAVRAKG
jgi:AraC-like DNA-binding protein